MKVYTFLKKWRSLLLSCGGLLILYGTYFFTHPSGKRATIARIGKLESAIQIKSQLEKDIAQIEYDIENMNNYAWYQERRARDLHYRYPNEEIWYVR
jgi:hypothetical protein